MKDIQVKVLKKQNMVNKFDKIKEDNPNLAEDMELIEELSLLSSVSNKYISDAETVGKSFRKILERINEFNNGEK